MKRYAMEGVRYGRWVVIRRLPPMRSSGGHSVSVVLARCDCGEIREVSPRHLRDGMSTSCGCAMRRAPRCPCGERDPTRYVPGANARCRPCDRRHWRNGSCDRCGVALYTRRGANVCLRCEGSPAN